MTLVELFQSIADAIREKTGKTDTLKPTAFSEEIASIQTGDEELWKMIEALVSNSDEYEDVKFVIPEGTTNIRKNLFYGCVLKNIQIPSSVLTLEEHAFYASKFKQISLPKGIKKIPSYCFQNSGVEEINLSGVTEIGDSAFYGSKIKSPDLSSLKTIVRYAFYNCAELETVTFGNGLTTIGSYAFWKTPKLATLNLPDTLTKIQEQAFRETGLTYLDTNKVATLEDYVFSYNTSLKSVVIADALTSVGKRTFYRCTALESVHIGAGLTTLSQGTFLKTAIQSLVIPSTVQSIGDYAAAPSVPFTVTMESETPCTITSKTFHDEYGTITLERIYVPKGCKATYVAATNWANYADYIYEPCVINISIASALLNNENYLYSMDVGETWEQFTDTLLTFENVTSIKFKNADANTTMLLGTTEGGDEIATIANAETIYNTSGDANIYITLE